MNLQNVFLDLEVLAALKKVHKRVSSCWRPYSSEGICELYNRQFLDREDWLDLSLRLAWLINKWPGRSGDRRFPIPAADPKDMPAAMAFYIATPKELWDRKTSQYARNRWACLEWMIAELEGHQ